MTYRPAPPASVQAMPIAPTDLSKCGEAMVSLSEELLDALAATKCEAGPDADPLEVGLGVLGAFCRDHDMSEAEVIDLCCEACGIVAGRTYLR